MRRDHFTNWAALASSASELIVFLIDISILTPSFRSKLIQQKYRPPLVCLNPGMQFFIRAKYEKPPPVQIVKRALSLSDGGIVAFDQFKIDKG